jgi:hypothetical protein
LFSTFATLLNVDPFNLAQKRHQTQGQYYFLEKDFLSDETSLKIYDFFKMKPTQ